MKTLHKALIALAVGSLVSVTTQAALFSNAAGYTGQPYAGVKIGQYSPDDADDDAFSYGVYGGYKFTPEFGVEAEYLTTNDADAYEDEFEKSEYSADVYGLYATYDYVFPNTALYAKGRLGFAKNKIDVDYTDKEFNENDSESFSETGIAGGLGLGYNLTPMVSTEVMYNFYPTIDFDEGDDIDANGVTLSAHFKF